MPRLISILVKHIGPVRLTSRRKNYSHRSRTSPRRGLLRFAELSSGGLSREERMFSQRLHNYRWNVTRPSDRRASNRRERANAYPLTIRRQSLWPLPRRKLVNHVMRRSEITPTCPRGCQSTWGLSGSPDHPSDYDVPHRAAENILSVMTRDSFCYLARSSEPWGRYAAVIIFARSLFEGEKRMK